jgi:hypothetical protein
LQRIDCSHNQLTQLNITSPNLYDLSCSNNQLSKINITYPDFISTIDCHNNRLSLSELYALHLLVEDNTHKWLGAQNLPPRWVNLNTELFTDQSIFDGIYTQYVVEIDGMPAPESAYTVTDGKLIFHTRGIYTVTMTNAAIVSKEYDIAKVTVVLEVVPVGILENDLAEVTVYPNPTTGEFNVQNSKFKIQSIEVFDVYGRNVLEHTANLSPHTAIDISHLPAGIYFVKIRTEAGEVVRKVVKY